MKKRSKILILIITVILFIIALLIIFFKIPYSPIKSSFQKDTKRLKAKAVQEKEIFTEEDIIKLPAPVQKYFRYCGFIGTPKMSSMKAEYKDVIFKQGKSGPTLSIDYTIQEYTNKPERIALIQSAMFGIPFEGYDSYLDGVGRMKGVVGKLITIFNYTGSEMDQASLVTYLSECLMFPNAALQEFIKWEAIDDTHAKAVISYYGITAQGVFTFGEKGEMLSFTTEDRGMVNNDGMVEYVKWSAICDAYQEVNGIMHPSLMQAVWHLDEGDFVYFDGKDFDIMYDVEE